MEKLITLFLKALLLFVVAISGFACGGSNQDDTENGSPDVTAPVISGITASAVTETEAILSWTTDESATSDIVYGLTAGYGFASLVDTTADKSGHNVVLSGLSPNTTYHCRVKSRDAAGNEAVSADFTLTTPAGTADLVISGVAHSDVTTSTALITWTTSVVATGNVEYGQDTSYGFAAPMPEDTGVDNTSHIVVLTGLDANTTYHYRVRSKNTPASEEVSADGIFTTLPDTAPPLISNVASSSITRTTANISWSTNEPATGQVDYGLDTSYGSTAPEDTNLITGHGLALSGLAPGTTYHYRVRAGDAANNETVSSDNTFTTLADTTAPVISSVTSLSITATSAIITWKTDEPATSNLVYGLTANYGSSLPAPADTTADKKSHSVVISGLSPGTLYHYQVKSIDVYSNEAISADETFTTSSGTTASSPGGITMTGIDLSAETVTIKNNGPAAVDMTGWRLWSVTGDQIYTFPSFTLETGATVLIVSGPGSVANPPAQLKWTGSYIWNNDGDPGELYDSSGNLVSSYP